MIAPEINPTPEMQPTERRRINPRVITVIRRVEDQGPSWARYPLVVAIAALACGALIGWAVKRR